jgi:hypothetical protein
MWNRDVERRRCGTKYWVYSARWVYGGYACRYLAAGNSVSCLSLLRQTLYGGGKGIIRPWLVISQVWCSPGRGENSAGKQSAGAMPLGLRGPIHSTTAFSGIFVSLTHPSRCLTPADVRPRRIATVCGPHTLADTCTSIMRSLSGGASSGPLTFQCAALKTR